MIESGLISLTQAAKKFKALELALYICRLWYLVCQLFPTGDSAFFFFSVAAMLVFYNEDRKEKFGEWFLFDFGLYRSVLTTTGFFFSTCISRKQLNHWNFQKDRLILVSKKKITEFLSFLFFLPSFNLSTQLIVD